MDYKNELDQVRALLRVALGNCDVALKQGAINASLLDCVLDGAERAVLRLRTVTEIVRKCPAEPGQKPAAPLIPGFAGILEVNEFGWLHITLNSLLPNCRYKTPLWLQNTLSTLLDDYTGRLPWFQRAILIIEEHCDIESRQVYDQDNKGWKAIPNALKGLVIPDDDQFTLEVALLSKRSDTPCCHIWLLPAEEAGEYFSVRSGDYGYTF